MGVCGNARQGSLPAECAEAIAEYNKCVYKVMAKATRGPAAAAKAAAKCGKYLKKCKGI